jgi:hypothetical protein
MLRFGFSILRLATRVVFEGLSLCNVIGVLRFNPVGGRAVESHKLEHFVHLSPQDNGSNV